MFDKPTNLSNKIILVSTKNDHNLITITRVNYIAKFTADILYTVIDLIYVTTKKEDLLVFPVFVKIVVKILY